MNILKIALIVDPRRIDSYATAFCAWATMQPGIELSLAVAGAGTGAQAGAPSRPADTMWRRWVGRTGKAAFSGGVMLAERVLLSCYKAHRSHLVLADITDIPAMRSLPRFYLTGFRGGLPDAAVDLFVHLGDNPEIPADMPAPRLGTMFIDYRRDRITPGAPIGFWEAYHCRPKTSFAIVNLATPGARRQVLVEGGFRTKFSFLLNQVHLFRKAQAQLQKLLLDIAASGRLPAPRDTVPYSGSCMAPPNGAESAVYMAKLLGRLAARTTRRMLKIQHRWNLCITHSGWRDATLWRGVRVSAPPGHFWADPFLHVVGGRTYCFVEDYVYATGRAHISVLEITKSSVNCLGVALREDFHLSFPFIFEYGGRTYMCPEASESNQVRIYECDEFPRRWSLHSVAIDNISAADSIFFEHKGKWWLLTSVDRSGLSDHCSELCLFSSDSPLDGQWKPHPANPLCIDTDMGRNAGLIMDEGRIFRAAQRQGFDQYGEGLALFEILVLDEAHYLERKVTDIRHDYLDRSLGSHHISSKGNVTVVDYKTHCFAP